LECFLARLVASPYADHFVLKGGVLLAAYDTRRPTRDIDLQGQQISNDVESVLDAVRAVAAVPVDDGLVLDPKLATADSIREADVYAGVRMSLTGELSAALPRLLDGEIAIAGYPLPMVHAEKLVTAVQRGVANTRWRDLPTSTSSPASMTSAATTCWQPSGGLRDIATFGSLPCERCWTDTPNSPSDAGPPGDASNASTTGFPSGSVRSSIP
jgi:hypothetical protein